MVGVLRFYQVFLRHNNVFIKHKEKPPIFYVIVFLFFVLVMIGA